MLHLKGFSIIFVSAYTHERSFLCEEICSYVLEMNVWAQFIPGKVPLFLITMLDLAIPWNKRHTYEDEWLTHTSKINSNTCTHTHTHKWSGQSKRNRLRNVSWRWRKCTQWRFTSHTSHTKLVWWDPADHNCVCVVWMGDSGDVHSTPVNAAHLSWLSPVLPVVPVGHSP